MKKFLLTALLFTSGSLALAVGAPAGTTISNTATLDLNDGVTSRTLTSNTVNVNVQQVYSVTVTPNGTTAAPGQTVPVQAGTTGTLTYTVTNTGNGPDSINLAALTANATAQGSSIAGIYLDNPTSGTVGSYDAGDTPVTSLTNVPADGTRTVFVRYTVPAGTGGGSAAGSAHQLNLTATSAGDAGKTDTDNVGQLTVERTIDLALASTQTKTVAAGGSVSFTDTLTNTGNTTLTAAEITTSTTVATTLKGTSIADTAFTTAYSVTGPGGTFTGSALDPLIDNAVGTGLASGSALTITVTVTPALTTLDASQVALTFKAYSPVTSGAVNNAPDGDPQATITNTALLQRGVAEVTKTVAKCTSSTACPARTAAGTADVSAKPGEYVVFYLGATNSGSGTLTNVRLSDLLPANFIITQVGATTSFGGVLKFSKDGTTWSTEVSSLGTFTGGSDRLYVAVENGGSNTTIDPSDTFAAGGTLRLKIVGYVRDGTTTGGTPARNDDGL
ncbi:hypothetical protein QOL99_02325 [Deinococcus sp. MIMF12]|uniref:DUF11 domain-containing protein n=1 Tax=Deinococcus rhizophilus TaxID=3049544 RepID=A0ABT7JER7_9DEIO|nr:hypothetical protein [Deinococcus rhizophilus]MDL2342980.1 hypothetical protein [Deinococcus rhizophilus]